MIVKVAKMIEKEARIVDKGFEKLIVIVDLEHAEF